MRSDQLIKVIEALAPLHYAADWDKSGVQAASFRQTVSRVAVMLDPRLETMKTALAQGADFILAHHPLSMRPRYPDQADDYLAVLSLLLKNEAWLYSAHTSLDASPMGTGAWLAAELGLGNVRTLEPLIPKDPSVSGEPGFGFAGGFAAPLPYSAFCLKLAEALGKDGWSACGPRPEAVSTVACCPGSGSQLMQEALAAGADVYITGDVKYHVALEAEDKGLRILDVGHFCLEEEMMRRFAAALSAKLPVPVVFYPGKDPLTLERVES